MPKAKAPPRRPGRVPLERALSKLGLASRTEARGLIQAGRVAVDGRIALCKFSEPLAPYERWEVNIGQVTVPATPGHFSIETQASGPEGAKEELATPVLHHNVTVTEEPTPFGLESYEIAPEREDGGVVRQQQLVVPVDDGLVLVPQPDQRPVVRVDRLRVGALGLGVEPGVVRVHPEPRRTGDGLAHR